MMVVPSRVYGITKYLASPRARWAVAVLVLAVNWDLLTNGTSSANMAIAYVTGLVASWGTIWWWTVLLVLEPQGGAARVRGRRGREGKGNGKGEVKGEVDEVIDESVMDGWEYYWEYYPSEGSFFERLGWVWDLMVSFRGVGEYLPFFSFTPLSSSPKKG